MARKNLLVSLTERKLTAVNPAEEAPEASLSPAMERNRGRGAFGAITRSIDELAEKAQAVKEFEARLLDGETVIDLDPGLIDVSFIADRLDDDSEAFEELLAAIRERGQDSPVLVRPHPQAEGRYMTVFGHRRVRAAKALDRKVRAVIKQLDDRAHVIAQGQENSARADLSFIEKAVFAHSLETRGYDRDVIMSALSVDKTVVSKMLSVAKDMPTDLVASIGAARASGRDRWYRLAVKLRDDDVASRARKIAQTSDFVALDSDRRLEFLAAELDRAEVKPGRRAQDAHTWRAADKTVAVATKVGRQGMTLQLTDRDAKPFGTWLSDNLDNLYDAFRKSNQ
ncbi:plasmid partitioning protein RepB [Aerobium aerolatum]|uniref:Chromosome partitioning protein, ParB family n=1 Tax=Aquamicrobium aerolatum DSM 21857 TaxID=1121003 RepID=A0A1I3IAZ2_9HYPH|nr:plasmid partitioning protein RepB [Aquamicrobium aerolatum]SFI44953.1 chromosome partitioning protein, ParB family [Aquamicrobium aerolatum DSM 21857]